MDNLNAQLFQGKRVLSMRNSGRLLQFVFDTNLLEVNPDLVPPVPAAATITQNPAVETPLSKAGTYATDGVAAVPAVPATGMPVAGMPGQPGYPAYPGHPAYAPGFGVVPGPGGVVPMVPMVSPVGAPSAPPVNYGVNNQVVYGGGPVVYGGGPVVYGGGVGVAAGGVYIGGGPTVYMGGGL